MNSKSDTVPFGVTFDSAGHLVVAESSTDAAVATFTLNGNGSLTSLSVVPTGEAATCWIAPAQGFLYASNAGSASVSNYRHLSGQLSLLGQSGTDPGTVDASASDGGQYLYVQTGGSGIVDEFQVNGNGSLTSLGSVTVAGAISGQGSSLLIRRPPRYLRMFGGVGGPPGRVPCRKGDNRSLDRPTRRPASGAVPSAGWNVPQGRKDWMY